MKKLKQVRQCPHPHPFPIFMGKGAKLVYHRLQMNQQHPHTQGFTYIELMIAVSFVSIVFFAFFSLSTVITNHAFFIENDIKSMFAANNLLQLERLHPGVLPIEERTDSSVKASIRFRITRTPTRITVQAIEGKRQIIKLVGIHP